MSYGINYIGLERLYFGITILLDVINVRAPTHLNLFNKCSVFHNVLIILPHHDKRNQETLLIIGDND